MSDFGNLLAYAEQQAGGAEQLQAAMTKAAEALDAKYHAKEQDKEKAQPAKR